MSGAGDIMEEVLGLFQTGAGNRIESVAPYFARQGLPPRWWTPRGYELTEFPSCSVLPRADLSYQEESRITAVILAAEELAAQGRPVPPDLAAVSALALALGLVTVTRKAQS